MRLSRLDLTRYGKFTDFAINFGERVAGTPDLHVIYGPNEAGKSTSLSAFLDLLFGIEAQSAYNFLHPYPSMQIGGALELGGVRHEFARVKARQASLLDARRQPIDEGILAGALSGISRDAYQTMFSLDDETLEAGGKSILASKGDLGQLLFSASAGLADLSHALTALREEADGFHKPRARTTELGEIKKQLGDLKDQKDAIDVLASAYANLIAERDNAARAYDEAMAVRTDTKIRMDEVRRFLDAMPRLAAVERLQAQLEVLADLPEPPMEWTGEIAGLMQNDTRLSTQLASVDIELARLDRELGAIEVDEPARALGPAIRALAETKARYITAEKDLPERRLSLRELDTQIAGILQRLGQPQNVDARGLLLSAASVGTFRALIESRSGIEAELQTCRREHVRAGDEFADAEKKLDAIGDVDGDEANAVGLSRLLRQLRSDDHEVRRRHAEAARRTSADLLEERLATLRPFKGGADELAELTVPEQTQIALWRKEFEEASKRLDRHKDELERLETAQALAEADLAALRAAIGSIADANAKETRQARDAAWAKHRATLDDGTAEAFETALEIDDELGGARLRQSTDLARLRQASQSVAAGNAAVVRARELRDAATAQLEALGATIRAATAPILDLPEALAAESALTQLEGWLERRGGTLETRLALRRAERDHDNAVQDGALAFQQLGDALLALGVSTDHAQDFGGLISLAEDRVEAETRRSLGLKAARERVENCEADLRKRSRDLKQAAEADRRWSDAWAIALEQCWMATIVPAPGLGPVREILEAVAKLGPALEKRDQLADRIGKMERDASEFVDGLAACVEELGESFHPLKIITQADALEERVERARTQHNAMAHKLIDREGADRRRQEISVAIAVHDARKAEFLTFFGVDTLNEVSELFEMVRTRNQLRSRLVEIEADLVEGLRLGDVVRAKAALAEQDEGLLANEAVELETRFKDLDQRTQQLYAVRSKASDAVEAVGGDDMVAKLNERRQTLLLELEEKALGHLRLRVGALAAEQALRAYRDKHRSSMMERASAAFSTISRGAYSGLAARPEKDTEVLIGLVRGGGSKLASEMSKGTRFQLYLALRVAGYYEFARTRQPVPFFADDIMETFDDFRAEEAFRLFAEMAGVGQVIYLTHHRHLCDIAKSVCPGVKIHELMPAG